MRGFVIRTIKNKNKKKINYNYHNETGKKLKSFKEKFYIPPAYKYVKINRNKNAKVLAIAKDDKNRSQYIYNKKFLKKNKKNNFKNLYNFGLNFEKIKNKIENDIKLNNNLSDIALILYLIMNCNIRIGNKKYTKNNNSYGASTLEKKHFQIKDNKLYLSFKGKKKVINDCIIENKMIINIFKNKLKKKDKLFNINNYEINSYLKQFGDITSKDIRTWNANILFIKYLINNKLNIIENDLKNAISYVSFELHNSPSVVKKEYIDPRLFKFYEKNKNKFINYFKNKNINKNYLSFLKKYI